jgi:hypothetical protein
MFRLFRRRPPAEKKTHRDPRRKKSDRTTATLEKFVVEEIELKDISVGPPPVRKKKPPPRWLPTAFAMVGWIGLWLILVLASLFARSPWPVDETRHLAIAWEMWQAQAWLVPRLNGEATAQAPLLAWLMQAGWKFYGVTEAWPRLAPALFGLASLFVTWRLARLFWPANAALARHAPLLLLGTFAFALFIPVTLPDMLRVFFTLLAWWALLIQWRHRDMRAWLLLGFALGAGLLAGGPLVFFYVLPPALLAPLWMNEGPRPNWKFWYTDMAKAGLLGAAVYAAWLVPAAWQTGGVYALALFQKSALLAPLEFFPGARPWWWYLLLLPLMLLPWSVWPLALMRLWHIRREKLNAGLMFTLVTALPALGLLSLFAIKQPPYLLPLLPLCVLTFAWLLFDDHLLTHGEHSPLSGMTLPLIAVGGALAAIPKLPRVEYLSDFFWGLSPFIGVSVIAVAVALAWLPARDVVQRVRGLVLVSVVLVVFVLFGVGSQFDRLYPTRELAPLLATAQQAGRPLAHVGDYHGEFHFAARLTAPLAVLDAAEVPVWAARHPDGLLVTYSDVWQPTASAGVTPVFETPYRDRVLKLWDAGSVLTKNP